MAIQKASMLKFPNSALQIFYKWFLSGAFSMFLHTSFMLFYICVLDVYNWSSGASVIKMLINGCFVPSNLFPTAILIMYLFYTYYWEQTTVIILWLTQCLMCLYKSCHLCLTEVCCITSPCSISHVLFVQFSTTVTKHVWENFYI